MPRIILPTYYYYGHFIEMLDCVEATYQHILDDSHKAFLYRFRDLTKDEQCLYVRLTNRKGYVFRRSTLQYEEIDSDAFRGLLHHRFIRDIEADDYLSLLNSLTKDRLLEVIRKSGLIAARASRPKNEVVIYTHDNLPYQKFIEIIGVDDYLIQLEADKVDFIIYLYFGKTHDDLKSFTLRDLNIIQVNSDTSIKARFSDALEAKSCFYYSNLLKLLKSRNYVTFEEGIETLSVMQHCSSPYALRLKSKVVCKDRAVF